MVALWGRLDMPGQAAILGRTVSETGQMLFRPVRPRLTRAQRQWRRMQRQRAARPVRRRSGMAAILGLAVLIGIGAAAPLVTGRLHNLMPWISAEWEEARGRQSAPALAGAEAPALEPRILRGGDAWGGIRGAAPATAAVGALAGLVTHVRDGDTIEVEGTPVRLSALDCPELGTAEGERAKAAMRRIAAGVRVSCRLDGAISYDRLIGDCTLATGQGLDAAMAAHGGCRFNR